MKHLLFALILATLAWNFFVPEASLPVVMTAAATVTEASDISASALSVPSQPDAYHCDGVTCDADSGF